MPRKKGSKRPSRAKGGPDGRRNNKGRTGPPLHPAEKYARDVVRGRVLAGELVRASCQKHLDERKRSETDADFPFFFDENDGDHPIQFFALLKHHKGVWAGSPIELEPWQQFIIWNLFGWKYRSDWLRRYRIAYIEVARKNGKSTLISGIGVYLLTADGEPGADVYCAATKLDQAKIIFEASTAMVKASPELGEFVGIRRNNLHVEATMSKYQPLGRDSKTLDGLNAHAGLVDELHEHQNGDLWDVLETSTGARSQPLMLAITTAGFDQTSFCYRQHEYARKILNGTLQDETFFSYVASLDPGDDWTDSSVWPKANPNLGVSVYEKGLAASCVKAVNLPAEQNNFRRKHMNQWVRARTRYLNLPDWDACAGELMPAELERENQGRRCWAGVDLSSVSDITALVLLFEPVEIGGTYDVLLRTWLPEADIDERSRKFGVPYRQWEREGFLTLTDGNVIDHRGIQGEIVRLSEIYQIQEIGFDPWNSQAFAAAMVDHGIDLVEMRQGTISMNEPTKKLEELVLAGRIRHGGNPVFRWAADNLEVHTGGGGLIKPVKPGNKESERKIDPMVSLILAIGRGAISPAGEKAPSIYESRGLR